MNIKHQLRQLSILIILLLGLSVSLYLVKQIVRFNPFATSQKVDLYFVTAASGTSDTLVKIFLDPKNQSISFARVAFSFDPLKVELKNDVTTSTVLTDVIEKTAYTQANLNGSAILVQAAPPSVGSPATVFEIANFTLKTKSSQPNDSTQLSFKTGDLQIVTSNQESPSINATAKTLTLNPVSPTSSGAPSIVPTVTSLPTSPPTVTPAVPTPTPTISSCGVNSTVVNNTCSCLSGWGNCDNNWTTGCESSLTSTKNCGRCGNVCSLGKTCKNGLCQLR